MFCPQCGQQQVSGVVRYCSRCGFPLDGVIQLLGNGGMLPAYRSPDEPAPMSPRRKGVQQGGTLLLGGAVLVPILGVVWSFTDANFLAILVAFASIICFVGGPLRMLYAGLFEEGAPGRMQYGPPAAAPQFGPPRQNAALPSPPARPSTAWRDRPNTSELANRPSVTENTTRLLDKDNGADR